MTDFGPYADAIRRHELALGRPAPAPTEPGKNGPRLSPAFVEFMMMLPAGHVTDPAIGLSRSQALRCLGNGVVPAQAALALRSLLGLTGATEHDGSALLPTPNVKNNENRQSEGYGPNLGEALAMLPTPVVNDMGDGKTPPQWDEWTTDMKTRHGNGNGHGRSLAIEAQRITDV